MMVRTECLALICCAVLVISSKLASAAEPPSGVALEFFESNIRPVLIDQCYECHNSAESAEGGLALDHRQALLKGGDNGAVLVPGKPAESRLLAVLRHEVEGLEMPQGAAKLDDRVLTNFEQWIAMGAPDPRDKPPSDEEIEAATAWEAVLEKRKRWWSFQPILASDPPDVSNENWSDHAIDRFVLAKLEDQELEPVARADAQTLVRRLFFVLIGLPPTPEEVQRWQEVVAEPKGYEQLVDHLLARPQFGERWARHWMDWIRYAESHGSEGDPSIDNAWHYRDYLIRALNDDIPFDQLVREHVAGDLLERPRINEVLAINESRIGPAHWRMVFHGFAPTDALDEKVRFTDDQINAFSKAFLGLTVSCARCHDHKFDAISQRDYYALFGILASCRPGRVAIDTDEQLNRNREQLAELKPQIRRALANDWQQVADSLADELLGSNGLPKDAKEADHPLHLWFLVQKDIDNGKDFATAWQKHVDVQRSQYEKRTMRELPERSRRWDLSDPADYAQWFSTGNGLGEAPSPAGEFTVATDGDNALTRIYPAGVYSHALSTKYAARLTSADVHLDGEYELWLQVLGDGGSSVRYVVQDYPRNGTVYPVPALKPEWKWQKLDLTYWDGDRIHIELTSGPDAPLLVKSNPRSWFGVREVLLLPKGSPSPASVDGEAFDPLFETTQDSPPKTFAELAACYAETLSVAITAWAEGSSTDSQAIFLEGCLARGLLPNRLAKLSTARPLIERYRGLEDEVVIPTRVPGLEETVARDQPLYHRGDHKQPMDEVPRRFLEAIDMTSYDTQLSGRRELAEDLVRDDNPLTRRVIVNRIWHHLFGEGIVATPDNFGSLGRSPTHPELLDWLATRFVADGWSLKSMIRQMVTSQTWQLDSNPPEAAGQLDPENNLLSHSNVRRLEAEAIRDAMLSVSGKLNTTMYGKPSGGASNRRSVYVEVKRNSLDPFLRVFDFPEPFTATGRRNVTNVPAQSLTMMNDERVSELASSWGTRVNSDLSLNQEQRIEQMFLQAFGRRPTSSEVSEIAAYLEGTETHYERLLAQVTSLKQQILESQSAIEAITQPTRQRLVEALGKDPSSSNLTVPSPIGHWEFDGDLGDDIGAANGSAFGGARLENDALVVDGRKAHMVTQPLKQTLREKTLEVWVQLDRLDQRGGGVMSVQTPNGVLFDSIVFGEQSPQQWLAGSNNFSRTQPFGGPKEQEALEGPVHLAIAYHSDGRIVGYRNGQPYGAAYQSEGPLEFKAGQTVVSFGVRHLPASGNRMLKGRIFRAHLYDRALSDEEIAATSQLDAHYISEGQVMDALTEQERQQVVDHQARIATLQKRIEALGEIPDSLGDDNAWIDLARALFSFKEFIFIK